MNIAYVGNFSQAHCTEVHLAATLENLGHQVMRLQEDERTPEELSAHFDVCLYDLFLYTRTWGGFVTKELLDKLRKLGTPSASYHLDLYVGLARTGLHRGKPLAEVLETDPFWRTDFVFTPDGDPSSAEVFRSKGVNHFYIKPGVFKPECHITPRQEAGPDRLGNEVIFVGGGEPTGGKHQYGHEEWPYRGQLLKWLEDTYGPRYSKYGYPQQTIRNEALNQLYANSKIVVGDSLCLDFKHTYYWSDRVYETLGRGGFIIHPFITGMDEEFKDGENIVFYEYNNWAQLKEKIDYYLEHEDERLRIRNAGHEFVKNHATYSDRLKQMLGIVFPNGWDVGAGTAFAEKIPDQLIKINLGSGNDPLPGHINVDMLERDDVDVVHNLMDFPYPFEDNSASHIKAIDVIEHLDHYTDDKRPTIMAFVEECSRILQVGGELYIQTPSWDSELFKIDPTHVRGFHPQSFDFFDDDKWYGQIRDFYGGAKFKVRCEELENKNLRFWLVKQ